MYVEKCGDWVFLHKNFNREVMCDDEIKEYVHRFVLNNFGIDLRERLYHTSSQLYGISGESDDGVEIDIEYSFDQTRVTWTIWIPKNLIDNN